MNNCCKSTCEFIKKYDPRSVNKNGSIKWFLYRWDDGKNGYRKLVRCKECGSFYLVQCYRLNKFSEKSDMGYATEAAADCIRYGFEQLHFDSLYSYMKYTNEASARVAVKNGMKFIKEYPDAENIFTNVYCIGREEWKNERTDKNIH